MNIPSFKEFLDTLTEEDYAKFFGDGVKIPYNLSGITPENISALISNVAMTITASSAAYCARFLEAYHDWLAKQLSQEH